MLSPEVCNKDLLCTWYGLFHCFLQRQGRHHREDESQRCHLDTFQILCGMPTDEVMEACFLRALLPNDLNWYCRPLTQWRCTERFRI